MLERNLARVYNKFKLHLYGQFLREPEEDQEEMLSVQEVVYMELIIALRRPTINDFAHYAGLSGPNAAYRINRLINKGYVSKLQSKKDKREYHLRAMPKYREKYGSAVEYLGVVADRMRERFTQEEIEQFDRMLHIMGTELMPEMHSLNNNRVDIDVKE